MTKHKGFWLITCFIAVAIAFAISNFALSNNFLAALDATDNKIVKCKNLGETHTVIIQNNQVNPKLILGKLCDKLIFTNKDNAVRLIAFGPHDSHKPYDSITEQVLGPDQSFNITFNELGSYHFHDHINDIIQGDFKVTK